MASSGDYARPGGVSIGRIFSRAFGVMGDNPATVFGLAFLFGALPQLALSLAGGIVSPELATSFGVSGIVFVAVAGVALYLLMNSLMQGALVRATVAYGGGRRAGFGECLRAGLTVALPLIGLSLIVTLGLLVGFLFLIVPAIMLYVRWAVAVAVLVEERHGVFAALGRSRDLSRGARWKIFGLGLVTLIVIWIASALIGVAAIAAGPAGFMAGGTPSTPLLVLNAVSTTLLSAFWSAVPTSLYVELREWKDGPAVERLADVFA